MVIPRYIGMTHMICAIRRPNSEKFSFSVQSAVLGSPKFAQINIFVIFPQKRLFWLEIQKLLCFEFQSSSS